MAVADRLVVDKQAEERPPETVLYVAEVRVEVRASHKPPEREHLTAYLTSVLDLPEEYHNGDPWRIVHVDVRGEHGVAGQEHGGADRGAAFSAKVD